MFTLPSWRARVGSQEMCPTDGGGAGLSRTGRRSTNWSVVAGLIMALSLVLAGCGGGASGQENGGEPVSGEIRIEGSSTVYPITQAAAELFRQENPDARIEIGGAGTSDGFQAFCQGDTQISDASRPIDPA